MIDFGEELTIETFKIPWLIWIQIIIILLLIILLYCFSLSPLDLSQENTSSTSLPPPPSSSSSAPVTLKQKTTTFRNHLQPSQRGESQSIKGEIATRTSRRIVRGEEIIERESTSSKESRTINYHPCHYFRIARVAFLKCLGLDSTSDNPSSSTSEHKKR